MIPFALPQVTSHRDVMAEGRRIVKASSLTDKDTLSLHVRNGQLEVVAYCIAGEWLIYIYIYASVTFVYIYMHTYLLLYILTPPRRNHSCQHLSHTPLHSISHCCVPPFLAGLHEQHHPSACPTIWARGEYTGGQLLAAVGVESLLLKVPVHEHILMQKKPHTLPPSYTHAPAAQYPPYTCYAPHRSSILT